MICANCGATNPSESAYCGGCGSFLGTTEVAVQGGAPGQEPAASQLVEPGAQLAAASNEDMPTFHTIQPAGGQESLAIPVEEVPTVRAAPAQPTPAASEFANNAPSGILQ